MFPSITFNYGAGTLRATFSLTTERPTVPKAACYISARRANDFHLAFQLTRFYVPLKTSLRARTPAWERRSLPDVCRNVEEHQREAGRSPALLHLVNGTSGVAGRETTAEDAATVASVKPLGEKRQTPFLRRLPARTGSGEKKKRTAFIHRPGGNGRLSSPTVDVSSRK